VTLEDELFNGMPSLSAVTTRPKLNERLMLSLNLAVLTYEAYVSLYRKTGNTEVSIKCWTV
jgi:hypothetical protein